MLPLLLLKQRHQSLCRSNPFVELLRVKRRRLRLISDSCLGNSAEYLFTPLPQSKVDSDAHNSDVARDIASPTINAIQAGREGVLNKRSRYSIRCKGQPTYGATAAFVLENFEEIRVR